MSCFIQVLLASLVLYCFTCHALLLTPGSCRDIVVLVAAVDERRFKLLVSGILQAYAGLARGVLRLGTASFFATVVQTVHLGHSPLLLPT